MLIIHCVPTKLWSVLSCLHLRSISTLSKNRKSNSSPLSYRLFISESGQVGTSSWLHYHLCQIFIQSGISPTHYSSHSSCIGSAPSASHNGTPQHLIQIMGRYPTNPPPLYLTISEPHRLPFINWRFWGLTNAQVQLRTSKPPHTAIRNPSMLFISTIVQ